MKLLKVRENLETGCLEWTGAKNQDGYGIFRYKKKALLVHRVTYTLCIGPIDNQLSVLHRCDNPSCVNPDHLFTGTQQENIKDMIKKGRNRNNPLKGENNPKAKLTSEQVAFIRKNWKRGIGKDLAKQFGVCRQTISAIMNTKIWRAS